MYRTCRGIIKSLVLFYVSVYVGRVWGRDRPVQFEGSRLVPVLAEWCIHEFTSCATIACVLHIVV